MKQYEAIVIGVSTGGLNALSTVLPALRTANFPPVVMVQHRTADSDGFIASHLDSLSGVTVKEAEYGELIGADTVYLAPAGYHLHIESDRTFRLSVDAPVNWSRPSVDVLFQSAAKVYGDRLVGVVLTGANADGAEGLKCIKERGGLAVVQNPATADAESMPRTAMDAVDVDHVLELEEIGPFLRELRVEQACP